MKGWSWFVLRMLTVVYRIDVYRTGWDTNPLTS